LFYGILDTKYISELNVKKDLKIKTKKIVQKKEGKYLSVMCVDEPPGSLWRVSLFKRDLCYCHQFISPRGVYANPPMPHVFDFKRIRRIACLLRASRPRQGFLSHLKWRDFAWKINDLVNAHHAVFQGFQNTAEDAAMLLGIEVRRQTQMGYLFAMDNGFLLGF